MSGWGPRKKKNHIFWFKISRVQDLACFVVSRLGQLFVNFFSAFDFSLGQQKDPK